MGCGKEEGDVRALSETASQNGRRPSFRTFCQVSLNSDRENWQVYILQLCNCANNHVLTVYVLARIRTDTSTWHWQAPVDEAPTVRYRQHFLLCSNNGNAAAVRFSIRPFPSLSVPRPSYIMLHVSHTIQIHVEPFMNYKHHV